MSAVAVLALFGTAEAASASTITKVTPEKGCPGENIVIEGTGFKANENEAIWEDHQYRQDESWDHVQALTKFVSATKMEALVQKIVAPKTQSAAK